ncbi:FliH/SctL family protein [Blastococcus brunescens]|uniref:FliH/SctL family protein n=1 Tax=Blastococcus brunescens TaxID=1564165 RepID=A0ABZ1B1X3_9ACTN|nr:FliH/SctL family protein [Blastococcus sp. BMG 8361]WRL64790.1 FliH/SctL family protein [Blastococcus sp. BMG 8361]
MRASCCAAPARSGLPLPGRTTAGPPPPVDGGPASGADRGAEIDHPARGRPPRRRRRRDVVPARRRLRRGAGPAAAARARGGLHGRARRGHGGRGGGGRRDRARRRRAAGRRAGAVGAAHGVGHRRAGRGRHALRGGVRAGRRRDPRDRDRHGAHAGGGPAGARAGPGRLPVLDAVRRALALCPADAPAVVRVHPDDLGEIPAEALAELPDTVRVVADPAIERAGAVAETGPRRIDAQLGAALERVQAVLTA